MDELFFFFLGVENVVYVKEYYEPEGFELSYHLI